MKKIKWLTTVLVVVSIVLGVIGCNNPSGPDYVPEMVYVKGATVTGALPAWLDESTDDTDKGVFI
ncbi:MAG: hypothetical protein IJX32_00475 [Spirochaetaceae bacterium]|nr:hypothetical protein [Spirochaetaceae bacterium]